MRACLSKVEESGLRPEGASLAETWIKSFPGREINEQFILGNSQVGLFSSSLGNCPALLQWNFYAIQVPFYKNSCSQPYFTRLDTSIFMMIKSLPESPRHLWCSFHFFHQGPLLQMFLKPTAPPYQKNKIMFGAVLWALWSPPFWRWRNWGSEKSLPAIL